MKFVVSVFAGLVMALLLFLLMHSLISGRQGFNTGADAGKIVNFIRIKEDDIIDVKNRKPPPPPEKPKEPPPPPKLVVQNEDKPPPQRLDIETPDVSVPIGGGSGPYIGAWNPGDQAAEGDVIPIVKIDPQWPREALLNGIEGFVEVEFTITPDGSVADVEVLNAEPRRLFVRDAIRAVLKWKFKPRIVDGKPVARRATQRIEFKLEDIQ